MNNEEFIKKAKQIHGDKYDYSKVEYTNNHTKVCIICPEHGEFWQRPNDHLSGKGCPECGIKSRSQKRASSNEIFINKARKIHGNKYDYSQVEYINTKTKVCIICPEHGEFWQEAKSHLQGHGCPKCSKNQCFSKYDFIRLANIKHGNKYDYSKVEYINSKTKVCIICPEHGEFWQRPNDHLKGKGCLKCGGIYQYTTEEFIEKAKQVHGDKYDYSKVKYVDAFTEVCIICPEHGEFWQKAYSHLQGKGCLKCGGIYQYTTEEFIEKAKQVHGDKYDYSKVEYINNKTKVCIICPEHGEFWQKPNNHLSGCGCPKCKYEKCKKQRQSLWEMLKKEFEIPTLIESGKYDFLVLLLGNMPQENKEKYKFIDKQIQRMLSLKQYPRTIDELDKYFDIYESEDIEEIEDKIDLDDIDSIPDTKMQKKHNMSAESINRISKVVEDNIDNFPPEVQEYVCCKLVNDKHRLNILQNGK